MDNAEAQIAELQQQVTLLRKELAQSEARLLTCLVKANAEILACQTEFAMFRGKNAKELASAAADRRKRHDIVVEEMNELWKNSRLIEHKVVEIQQFLWPVVENIFPNLLAKCTALSKRFKEPGLYSEPKPPK